MDVVAPNAAPRRRLPPVWLMGFCNFLQRRQRRCHADRRAAIAGGAAAFPNSAFRSSSPSGFLPSVTSFVLSPNPWIGAISRRSYSVIFAILAGFFQFLALVLVADLLWLTIFLFLAYTAVMLYVAATGGWLAGLTGVEEKNRLGAWLTVWNVGGWRRCRAFRCPASAGASVRRRRRDTRLDAAGAATAVSLVARHSA